MLLPRDGLDSGSQTVCLRLSRAGRAWRVCIPNELWLMSRLQVRGPHFENQGPGSCCQKCDPPTSSISLTWRPNAASQVLPATHWTGMRVSAQAHGLQKCCLRGARMGTRWGWRWVESLCLPVGSEDATERVEPVRMCAQTGPEGRLGKESGLFPGEGGEHRRLGGNGVGLRGEASAGSLHGARQTGDGVLLDAFRCGRGHSETEAFGGEDRRCEECEG